MKHDKTEGPKMPKDQLDIPVRLAKIEARLKFQWIVGSVIVIGYGIALGWFFTAYLPGKLSDEIPPDFRDRFTKMEQKVSDVEDRLNHLTPSTLNDLLSTPGAIENPNTAASRLRRAGEVIDVALKSQIPASPGSLPPIISRVADIKQKYPRNQRVRDAAMSIETRLTGYELASDYFLQGQEPIQSQGAIGRAPLTGLSLLANFTMRCTNPAAHFLASPMEVAVRVAIFQLHVDTCSQQLDGFKWIKVEFSGATIEYGGGPLYLADVTFKNCKFSFGTDPNSKVALEAIKAAKESSVNLVIAR